jgi:hypothetical protein
MVRLKMVSFQNPKFKISKTPKKVAQKKTHKWMMTVPKIAASGSDFAKSKEAKVPRAVLAQAATKHRDK